MIRLFHPEALRAGERVLLAAGAARHAQVLRLQPGDDLLLFDGLGGEWSARVARMGRSDVEVDVQEHLAREAEAAREVTLALAMPTNERMDFVIEKCTELGVARVVPLISTRSVLRLDGPRAQRKQAHWQAIAVAACEQSGRNRVPRIEAVDRLASFAPSVAKASTRIVLSTGAPAAALATLLATQGDAPVTLLVGPEGGFTPEEERCLREAGWLAASLGPRVLRADTAALLAVGIAALEA